jgi:hypothetical protein
MTARMLPSVGMMVNPPMPVTSAAMARPLVCTAEEA